MIGAAAGPRIERAFGEGISSGRGPNRANDNEFVLLRAEAFLKAR